MLSAFQMRNFVRCEQLINVSNLDARQSQSDTKMNARNFDDDKQEIESDKLGKLTVFKEKATAEIHGTVDWDGQDTGIVIFCENITEHDRDMNLAISWVESRLKNLFLSLPLFRLRRWCWSQIQEQLPWFLSERIQDPDSGEGPIRSKPEEMVDLLIPELKIHYDFSMNQTAISGCLTCPPLNADDEINFDVNRWLGNHNYVFSLSESNAVSGFRADG